MGEWGVGTQLRAIRLDRGLTLEQLAESSGVSVRGISGTLAAYCQRVID